MEGSVEDFYQSMTEYEEHFRKLLEEAKSKVKSLKYVVDFKDGKAKVGLQKYLQKAICITCTEKIIL